MDSTLATPRAVTWSQFVASGDRSDRWTATAAWTVSSPGCQICALLVAAIAGLSVISRSVPAAAAVGVVALVPAGLVDVVERRLPNRMVLAAATALVVAICVSLATGADIAVSGAALGACMMAAPLLILHLVSPDSMGLGDVKVAAVLGASLGMVHPQLPLVGLLIAATVTAAVGLLRRVDDMAFGPGLIAGSAIALALSVVAFSTPPTTGPKSRSSEPVSEPATIRSQPLVLGDGFPNEVNAAVPDRRGR